MRWIEDKKLYVLQLDARGRWHNQCNQDTFIFVQKKQVHVYKSGLRVPQLPWGGGGQPVTLLDIERTSSTGVAFADCLSMV